MRTSIRVIWPVEFVRSQYGELNISLNRQKLLKIYPFIKDANYQLTPLNKLIVNTPKESQKSNKDGKSKAEQKKLFEHLLASGEVKNQSAIARKFGVSRAWVSKVLNS
ncbi:hypothetical protein [Fodinibius sediminis]|uniref:hypothetical protein n=1 Tax=Fodinibius sediminis TaxID=1214077 RepID=UPI0011582361|nr:hypothetical protein [Fodinibius sediminis]